MASSIYARFGQDETDLAVTGLTKTVQAYDLGPEHMSGKPPAE
ncbi:hypothetical protein ACQPX6_19960 [Actinomycetospora sp. CA-101289]